MLKRKDDLPVDRILAFTERHWKLITIGAWLLFCAWFLRLRVRTEGQMSVLAELTHEEFPSLYALFDAFMQRPGSMGLAAPAASGTK